MLARLPGFPATTPSDTCFIKYSGKYDGLGYTFDLEWQPRGNLLAYLATRRGWKAGGFDSVSPSTSPEYNPEVLKDVEIGTKFDWSSENIKGHLNVDYFHSWYSQLQQQVTALVNGGGVSLVVNAGAAQIGGGEIEASSTFYNRFSLSAFYSYINAGYDRCPPNPTPANCFMDLGVNVSASRLLGTAKNTVGSTARYIQPLGVAGSAMGSVMYYLRSSTAYASDNVLNYETIALGYDLLNARLEWSNVYSTVLSIATFANNVANKVIGLGPWEQDRGRYAGLWRAAYLWNESQLSILIAPRTQMRSCDVALEMGVGLPRSACRSRSQTAECCCGSMAVVVSDHGKGIPRGCQVSIKEMSAS